MPTLIGHGDDDQIVPIVAAAYKPAKLIKDATLQVHPGTPQGLAGSFNADLLAFIERHPDDGVVRRPAGPRPRNGEGR